MGPLLIFDKSALQSFSLDESVWLENFFLNNITPLFYVESLADLEKAVAEGKTPESVVGSLAEKTPVNGTFYNVPYAVMIEAELMGYPIEMEMRAIVRRGKPKITPEGKKAVFYDQSPEEKAFHRWVDGEFLEVERDIAKEWRQSLSGLNFDRIIATVKNVVPANVHFSNMSDVKKFVDSFVSGNDPAILQIAFELLAISDQKRKPILDRWEKLKRPSLKNFAPYAAYVFSVDLFCYLSMNKSFIAKERPSNKIDLAYLYYLPFCMVFVSSDNLHARTAPLFLTKYQRFVKGSDFKAGLKELDNYFSKLPEEVKEQGVMKFANYPPQDVDTFIGRLLDDLRSSWREDAKKKKGLPKDKELINRFNKIEAESQPTTEDVTSDEADSVFFERRSKIKKGKWYVLPKDILTRNKD